MAIRVAVVIGTRPEAIKMAPVIHALRRREDIETVVVATGQHREMLDQVLSLFRIRPDVALDVMQPNQTLNGLTARVLTQLSDRLANLRPDLLLAQGDTTTAFAAALAAFYLKIPVGHVEAGLRSGDAQNPFPEEINRRLVSVIADLHFAPTRLAADHLLREGVPAERVVVTGNTVVDALSTLLPTARAQGAAASIPLDQGRLLLVTSHRRESWGPDLEAVCFALRHLVAAFPDVQVVYPVHMNPHVRSTVTRLLAETGRVHLVSPVDYLTFLQLMDRAHIILTDSGGVQEEAPSLRKPVLVLRKLTERPEACDAGAARIVGTDRHVIVRETSRLLSDERAYHSMTSRSNPFGDGHAASRVVTAIDRWSAGIRPLLSTTEAFAPADAATPALEFAAPASAVAVLP